MSASATPLFPFHLTPGGPKLSQTLLSEIPSDLRENPEASLLLMGCRLGENLIAISEHFAGRLIGIEEDTESIFHAKMAITESALESRVSARLMAPVQTNFRPGQFDVVMMEGIFSGYPPTRVLKEALRVLQHPGWLLLSDSCWLEQQVPTYVRDVWESREHKLLTREALRTLLEERGLEIITLEDRSDVLEGFYHQFTGTVKGIAKGGFEGMKHLKGLVKHYKHEIDVYRKHGGDRYMGYMSAVARRIAQE
jgi:SAM-dependent methyltransferase